MSSYRKLTRFAAAAALVFAIGVAVTPANAILNPNALTQNALAARVRTVLDRSAMRH